MALSIEAVLIETSRLDILKEFYRAGFDLDDPDTSDSEQVGFQIGDVYFGLERVEVLPSPSRTMSLWFKVDDAQAMFDRLIELGATPKDPPSDQDGEVIASVYDPDGNSIGLISDSD